MQFIINGTEYKLVFQHATFKRQMPSRFGAASGLTSCTIYQRGRDLPGKHTDGFGDTPPDANWVPKYHTTIIQHGNFNYIRGQRCVLAGLLREIGWERPVRKVVWAAFNNRSRISMWTDEAPWINAPIVRKRAAA